jgi:molecular chaperone DnaK
MADYHKVIGIDLGTTFSCVAVYSIGKADVIVIPNDNGKPTTPSVVHVAKNRQITVGEAARKRISADPNGVIIEAKRMMGERDSYGVKQTVTAGGQTLEPEVVSAFILKELKGFAERYIGEPIHDAVITVPAYFKEPQKNATRDAAKMAKLNPLLIVNEPTAAAVAYGLNNDEDSNFIVYDFGGGTFDVSVVRVRPGDTGTQFNILGTGGDARLGGGDIDQLIIDWVLSNLRKDLGRDVSQDSRLVGRIRLEAEQIKINLCNSNQEQEFIVDGFEDVITYTLAVGEFKRMIRPIIDRTLREVEIAMKSATENHGVTLDRIDSMILVGGSSRIPFVKEALAERFQKPIKADLNPDEIVAIGAARMAMDYQPSLAAIIDDAPRQLDKTAILPPENIESKEIIDVVSHTLGIGLKDDVYDALIMKDAYIPAKATRGGYATAADGQTSIWVPVYQGDNPRASLNYLLGEVVIADLDPAPAGTHRFEVTFALDVSGIFYGKIVHQQTGKQEEIKLQRGQDMLTAKRRVELAVNIEQGLAPLNPESTRPPGDDIVTRAETIKDRVPAGVRAELDELLSALIRARQSSNKSEQAALMLRISIILASYSHVN